MTFPTKSGYYIPNRIALIHLQAMEQILGRGEVGKILDLAGLDELVDSYPPNDLGRSIDFSGFSALNQALEVMFGDRSGRGLAQRSAWAAFNQALRSFDASAEFTDPSFRYLPLSTRIGVGLRSVASMLSRNSDQLCMVEESEDAYTFTVTQCPYCWGRTSDRPICNAVAGILEASLRWFSRGQNYPVHETHCVAVGDEACQFHITKSPID